MSTICRLCSYRVKEKMNDMYIVVWQVVARFWTRKLRRRAVGHAFIIKKIKIIVSVLMVSVLMFAVLDYCLINYSVNFLVILVSWLYPKIENSTFSMKWNTKVLRFTLRKKKTYWESTSVHLALPVYAVCNRISFYVYTKHIAFALK
jgi:hypothetical protein